MNTTELAWCLTLAFLCALLLGTLAKCVLAYRQGMHLARHFQVVPPDFASQVNLAAHHKATFYTLAKLRLGLAALLVEVALLMGWTLFGGLDALNQWAHNPQGWPWLHSLWAEQATGFANALLPQLLLVGVFVLIGTLVELPLSLYSQFVVEERFGFNTMTWRLWLQDLAKSALLGLVLGLPLLAGVLWLMAQAGSLWWLWAWGGLMAFNLLLLWVYPRWLAPLFNRFTPLQDEALKAKVTRLMQSVGLNPNGFFVMDGSRRSKHANAYFTGLGRHKRVVFFDTLLSQLSADEVEAVLAHEIGHFKHGHIRQRLLGMFLGSLAVFALVGFLVNQTWFYTGLGVQPNLAAPNDALALILLSLVLPVFAFWFSPLLGYFSRRQEFQADAFAAKHSPPGALRSALLKLYESNAAPLTSDPWYTRFYASHPGAQERLARLNPLKN